MKLTSKNFFALLVISHLAFLWLLFAGTLLQIAITIFISCFIILFSSTIVYHRFLSHRNWNAPRWYEIFGTVIGIFSFTGTPITRTLAHRYHHAYADTEKDPHSPKHMSILNVYFPMFTERKLNPVLVRDLLADKFHCFIHENYLSIIALTVLLSFLILGPVWTICIFVAPGALCWFNISLCNIFCHIGDDITQSRLLGALTFGEGFHKHHHSNPSDPNFGKDRIDIGYIVIKWIEKYGHR